MSRSAPRVLLDVMDLAPLRRNVAARNDAAAVAKGDRPALVVVENSVEGLDRHDTAVGARDHALDGTAARDVPRRGDRDGSVIPGQVRMPTSVCQVFLTHRDDESG